MQRIANGSWGGQHIHVEVSPDSATVSFDCAHGTIEGPLTIDSRGEFNWKGTFAPEHGGPVREEENDTGEAAIYSGTINGQAMMLTLRLADQKEPLDKFVLTQGKAGRIRKCL